MAEAIGPEHLRAFLKSHLERIEAKHDVSLAPLSDRLRGASLASLDLNEAVLTHLDLTGADFRGTNLVRADFTQACCQGANFGCDASGRPADLSGAKFRDADLTNADFSGAIGITAGSLGGAILAGAKLPEPIARFEGLAQVTEISKNGINLFFLAIGAYLYCWLIIGTTYDVALIVNSSTIPLPIIGTPLQPAGFYYAAPLILTAVYLYFILYLQRLWGELAALPAIFPDGRALDEKAYPWLVNGIIRSEFRRLAMEDRPLAWIESRFAFIFAWLLIPFTLAGFWLRYLPRHDWWGSSYHAVILSVAITSGLLAHTLARSTLHGAPTDARGPRKAHRLGATFAHVLKPGTLVQGGIVIACIISLTAAAAVAPGLDPLSRVGFKTTANLREADLSTKLSGWKKGSLDNLKRIDLRGYDLRGAQAQSAFLAGALLDGAQLDRADFSDADLQGASLSKAKVRNTIFDGANLTGEANLFEVQGENASFKGTNLTGANFHFAQLCGVNFEDADLSKADMADTNLASAHFVDTNMQQTQLGGASMLFAEIGGDVDLQGTSFVGADLCGAKILGDTGTCRPDPKHRRPTGARAWPNACLNPNDHNLVPD